jgi:hypothetical protein
VADHLKFFSKLWRMLANKTPNKKTTTGEKREAAAANRSHSASAQ